MKVTKALNANTQERSATSSGVKRKSVKETAVTTSSSSSSSNKKGAAASASKAAPLDGRKKRRCHSAETVAVKTAASFSESDTSLGENRNLLAPRHVQLQQQSG